MSRRMKNSSALSTDLKQIETLQSQLADKIQPDFSQSVEAFCTRVNSFVLASRQMSQRLVSYDFSNTTVREKKLLLEVISMTEQHLESTRDQFIEFQREYKALLTQGWKVNSFARTCLHNADQATKNAVIDFEVARSEILLQLYDKAPSAVLHNSKSIRFGEQGRGNIAEHLAQL